MYLITICWCHCKVKESSKVSSVFRIPGNGHMTSDDIINIHTDWLIEEKQVLLPVG